MTAWLSLAAHSFAQLPNGGFELWPDDCTLDSWYIDTICGVAAPVTKTTEAHGGNFAVRGEVVGLFGTLLAPVIQSGVDAEGVPITKRYTGISAFYRFAPIGGDRFGLNVALYKGDAVIAQGAALFPATTGALYAPCNVVLTYTTQDTPDRAIVQAQIIGPVTGSDYHLGSVIYLDDISATGGDVTTSLPSMTMHSNPDGTITINWPPDATSYHLEQRRNLVTGQWTAVGSVNADGHSYTIAPTALSSYFRLASP